MNDTQNILKKMMALMERELEEYFYRVPIDRTFRPKLDAFLRQWEKNFAPYSLIKFDYRIDGQHLDINATIPQLSKFIIDLKRRYPPLYAPPNPKWGF